MIRAMKFILLASSLCLLYGCMQNPSSKKTGEESEASPTTEESSEESGLEQGVSQVAEGYSQAPGENDAIGSDKEKEIYLYMKSLYNTGGQNTQDAITEKASNKFEITQEQAGTIYMQYEMKLSKPK
ncbi:hypothetical protein ACQKL6_15825 [Peribacillus sp. NPDC097197]|uniref:hypothetical protein n=1 Tax=Peribacillus sp. NPDC097197 TaxID=3390615 RepID=UPI003D04F068